MLLRRFIIEHKIRVMPPPIATPITPIVKGKNFLPVKVTKRPRTIAIGPMMKG